MTLFAKKMCCCCIKLKAGTILISLFGIFVSVSVFTFGLIASYGGNIYYPSLFDDFDRYLEAKTLMPAAIIIFLIECICLYGAIMESRDLFIPWLVLYGSFIVSALYLIVSLMVILPYILIALVGLLIFGYYWTVVFSYYRALEIKQNQHYLKQNGKV